MNLNQRWMRGTLNEEDVKTWMKGEREGRGLNDEELSHIVKCLHHIYLWHKKGEQLGSFLQAVVKNDFMEICGRADDTNFKVLTIYTKFLYNHAPGDWRSKAIKQFGEAR